MSRKVAARCVRHRVPGPFAETLPGVYMRTTFLHISPFILIHMFLLV